VRFIKYPFCGEKLSGYFSNFDAGWILELDQFKIAFSCNAESVKEIFNYFFGLGPDFGGVVAPYSQIEVFLSSPRSHTAIGNAMNFSTLKIIKSITYLDASTFFAEIPVGIGRIRFNIIGQSFSFLL
jgi:hypothetical protein